MHQRKSLIRKIPMNLYSPLKLYSKMYLKLKSDLPVLRKSLKKLLKRINKTFYFLDLSKILLSVTIEFGQNVEFTAKHDKRKLFIYLKYECLRGLKYENLEVKLLSINFIKYF